MNKITIFRNLKKTMILLAGIAFLSCLPNKVKAQIKQQPNIVILFADDLNADEINVTSKMTDIWPTPSGVMEKLGYFPNAYDPNVYTPNIDALADQGILFTNFHVNGTVCSASRYNILTGRYAFQGKSLLEKTPAGEHHTLGWEPDILRAEDNLPKQLKNLGYRTGIIGKWHNDEDGYSKIPKEFNIDKKKYRKANASFETTLSVQDKLKKRYDILKENLSHGYGWDVVDRMEWGNSIVNLDWQCEGALDFIEESKDKPFFLYCALPVPHGQYRFAYNDITSYDRRVTSYGILDEPANTLPSDADVLRRTKENGVSNENAMASRMDDYVGAVLNKLDELGLRENTIVLFTSDHGGRGKNSCYQGGAKVPLIVSWPGKVKSGSQCESLIGGIDFTSTLVELAGGEPAIASAPFSLSFVPQLIGGSEPKNWRKAMLIEAGNSKAIITKDWKYIANRVPDAIEKLMKKRPNEVYWTGVDHHNYNSENMYPAYWDSDQLYDLNTDLYEQNNVATKAINEVILDKLKKELGRHLKTMPHAFGEYGK